MSVYVNKGYSLIGSGRDHGYDFEPRAKEGEHSKYFGTGQGCEDSFYCEDIEIFQLK